MMLFSTIEDELAAARNPTYLTAYEGAGKGSREKSRVFLVVFALSERVDDDECLRIIGNVFEKLRTGFMTLMYWDRLDDMVQRLQKEVAAKKSQPPDETACTVM